MTASTNLGKVAMIPKGIWNAQTAYTKLNVVTIGGSSYLAVQDVPAGTSVSNTAYWQVMAEKGTSGGVGQLADEFNPNNSYAVGDYCSYNQDVYRFTSAHTGAWDVADVVLVSIANELKQKMTESEVEALIESSTASEAVQLETAREIAVNLESNIPATFDGSQNIETGVTGILPIANGGTGNVNGTAAMLSTPRTILTDLESGTASDFDGSEDITPGVTGILPKANGGTGNGDGTADKLTTARSIRTNLASTSTASFDGSANITPGVTGILPVANGGTGNSNGTVGQLTTARTIRTNLASTSTASFDGSANITPGVTGILPFGNGGTGGTDSGWKTLTNTGVFNGTILYRKIGAWCFVQGWQLRLKSALSSGTRTIATIPDGYRPVSYHAPFGGGAPKSFVITVSTSGDIIIYYTDTELATSNNISFSHMYFCA